MLTSQYEFLMPLKSCALGDWIGYSLAHSSQIAKASSCYQTQTDGGQTFQAQNDTASMIVGWTISFPGNTPQVTVFAAPSSMFVINPPYDQILEENHFTLLFPA